MLQFREFLKSGHAPTLWSSFLYFGFSCAVWVINGAMAPFIRDAFQLTQTQMGMMLSIPIFAGALMRFPLGILAQYIGRKNATLVEMAGIFVAMGYGYLFVHSYNDLLAMGILLGVAGASFGVALSLGSGSFPPRYKGLAMGIVGAGNVGTAVAALLAPMMAAFLGAALRVFGGWLSDHWGGVNTLTGVLAITAASMVLCGLAEKSLPVTMLLFLVCFAALGAGNGALFQLVPLRWPLATAVAGSMIGEIGALGGGLIPNGMGISRQYTGTYLWGFVGIAVCALAMLVLLRVMQIRWTRTWAEKGGRARSA